MDPEKPLSPEARSVVVEETSDFVGFGEGILGKRFHPKQKEVLTELFKEGSNVSFVSCNDGGKTREVIATAVLAHLVLFPRGRVMTTSGSFRQIKDQLNPELHKYASRFPQLRFMDCRIQGDHPNCFWHGFSTSNAGLFEGQHAGGPDEPLMIIYDEAKTIKDPLFLAGDRCRTTRKLYASSAGYAQGEFYASQTVRRAFFTPIKQTAADCPHIPLERIAMMRKKWGADHVLVKSALDAEFMSFVEGAIIQLAALDANIAASFEMPHKRGERKAFCDFAWSETASGDENVLALRDGNKITIESAFRAKGIYNVAGRFVHEFKRLGLHAWEIEGDADGEGANIIKHIRDMGWTIGSCHNGGPPRHNDHYHNCAAEMWCEGGQAIIQQKFILPDDPEMYGQMLNRKLVPSNSGKLAIESKQVMKDPNREGGPVQSSPDRADAVFGAMAPLPLLRSQQVMGNPQEPRNVMNKGNLWGDAPAESDISQVLPGAWGG